MFQCCLPAQWDFLASSFTQSLLSVCVVAVTSILRNYTPLPTAWTQSPYHLNCRLATLKHIHISALISENMPLGINSFRGVVSVFPRVLVILLKYAYWHSSPWAILIEQLKCLSCHSHAYVMVANAVCLHMLIPPLPQHNSQLLILMYDDFVWIAFNTLQGLTKTEEMLMSGVCQSCPSIACLRTLLGVDQKSLSIRKEPMLSGLLTLNAHNI